MRRRTTEHDSEALEAVGRLAGGVAHELNDALMAVRGHAELALERLDSPDAVRTDLAEVIAAADRAAALIQELLAFGRRQTLSPQVLDLRELVRGLVPLLRRLVGEDVELATSWPRRPTLVRADRAQLERALANLALNAREAMPAGGRLAIEVARSASGGTALVTVRDEGTGMDAATAARAFEPFFGTKGGSGLGLSVVHGIVGQSGGRVEVESEPGSGTAVTISLPIV